MGKGWAHLYRDPVLQPATGAVSSEVRGMASAGPVLAVLMETHNAHNKLGDQTHRDSKAQAATA